MSELGSQQDYWNDRVATWHDMKEPLIPDQEELDFARKHLADQGDTLILGATPQLCDLALETSASVLSVDYAAAVIKAHQREGVRYHRADWSQFFTYHDKQYDTVMTDGGLLCLEFPHAWEMLAMQIHDHLKPEGKFVARVYVNTEEPPQEHYDNPNLERFVTSMGDVDENWMVHPHHGAYAKYNMRYAFPPEREIQRVLGQFALLEKHVPEYEEGKRFVSYAWQK